MSLKLRLLATEKSSYILEITFELLSRSNVRSGLIPNSDITWTLCDQNKTVINNKENITLPNDNIIYIILSGEDLCLDGYPARRLVIIEGTYNNLNLSNIPFYEEIEFIVEDVKDRVGAV